MGMKLTPEERLGLSPDEIAALESETAEQALATMGDQAPQDTAAAQGANDADDEAGADDDANTGAADADDTADDTAAAAPAAGTLTPEQLAAIAQDTQQATAEAPKLPTYAVPERDFKAEREALRASRREIQSQWDKGDLTDEELAAKLDEVDQKLEDLTAEKVRADTLREINEQHAREAQAKIDAEFNTATAAVIKAAAASTTSKVDYVKDKAAQRQFDMALDMLQADPENAGKTPTQLVQEAHKAVLVIRGLPVGAPAAAAPAAPAAPKPRNVPMTLSGIPNASQVPLEDETMAQVAKLSGEDLEQFLARMTPAQQQRLLRNIDNAQAVRH